MNKHYDYIDILKGIGIVMVVFGHLNPGIYLEKWIYSFHMFLFFFLSGYVFKKKSDLKHQFKASFKTLIIPYIFWNGLAIIFSLIIQEYTIVEALKKMLFFDGVSWNSPVWFLVVLFWIRIFYQLISTKKFVIISIMSLMLIGSYYSVFSTLPFGFDIVPNAIIFFGIGILLRDIKIPQKIHFLFIPLLIMSMLGSQLNDRISVYGNYYGQYIIAILTGICACVGMFLLIKYLTKPTKFFSILKTAGGHSMNIMCTHYFILRFFSELSIKFFGGYDVWHAEGLIKAIFMTGIIFIVEILIVNFLKKLKVPDSHIMRL